MRKIVLLFSLLLLSMVVLAQENKYTDPVEQMARFPGGEVELYQFIQERLFYPWDTDSVEGVVKVLFVVSKFGDAEDVRVIRGVNPLADSIAVSIIRQMPRWIPATQNGIPVSIKYTLPITFDPQKIDADKKLNTTSSIMPSFKGGEAAMYKFIAENLRWPAIEASVQGKVVVQFIIDSKGKIWHPYVFRSLHPDFDAEALRVVRMMPDWEPLKNSGGCHLFTLPIKFRLE